MDYTILKTDGTRTVLKKKPDLATLQKAVGGLIERVVVPGGEMWVNEEGKLMELPLNAAASRIARTFVVGDVVLCLRKKRQKEGKS